MKYLKMLALTAVAAGAFMAYIGAGTASANVICSTTADPCPTGQQWPNDIENMDFSLTGGTAQLINKEVEPPETIDTCTGSTLKGTFTQGTTASNPGIPTLHATELTWTGCSLPTKTLKTGTLEISKIAGTSNGTVRATGFEVTINTVFFGSCVYGTSETQDLGTLTEGNPAVFHAEVHVPFISGGAICPRTAEWKATYAVTAPSGTTGSISSSVS